MENAKFNWPRVRIGTTPETRYINDAIEWLDRYGSYRKDLAGLHEMADFADSIGCPEMAQTLREYAQKGTR